MSFITKKKATKKKVNKKKVTKKKVIAKSLHGGNVFNTGQLTTAPATQVTTHNVAPISEAHVEKNLELIADMYGELEEGTAELVEVSINYEANLFNAHSRHVTTELITYVVRRKLND